MAKASSVSIAVEGERQLSRALRALGEKDAPFMRAAMEDVGPKAASATRTRAKGGIASTVAFGGVRGSGVNVKAVVTVKHPGAKAMEFGRTTYYRGYTGRKQKSGQKFKASPGQRARPFVGIKDGGHAIGAVRPHVIQSLTAAIKREWARIAGD